MMARALRKFSELWYVLRIVDALRSESGVLPDFSSWAIREAFEGNHRLHHERGGGRGDVSPQS